MDIETARWLVSPEAAPYIAQVHEFDDPSSLKAGTALRQELSPEKAAAVADLESLRRKGTGKLGDIAQRLFLTHDGLEQATRFPVAQWRAKKIATMANRVIDAGCGLGIDALAARMAGMEVVGIEKDPVTAVFAGANMGTVEGPEYEVHTGTVEDIDWESDPPDNEHMTSEDLQLMWRSCLRQDDTRERQDSFVRSAGRESGIVGLTNPDSHPAIYLDPSRRTAHGRSWNVEDLSPSWEFVLDILHNVRNPVVVKLAPGFPRRLLPADVDITLVSHKRNLVETTLWSWPGMTGLRQAVILNDSESDLLAGPPPPPPGPVGAYILEPDPAVIRAGAIGALAQMTGTHPIADSIAYLTGPEPIPTPFATAFEILDTLPFSDKEIRAWVRRENIGVLEIKQRGLDIDPATFRRTLKLKGDKTATIICTPTSAGAAAFVVQRTL